MKSLAVALLVVIATPAFGEQVSVDFGSTYGPLTHKGSGVLHSLSPTAPDDSLLTPINPSLFRAFPWAGNYERAVAHDAAYQIVLSDTYTLFTVARPGDGGAWSEWEQTCRDLATQALADGKDIQFDIWNEPDMPNFWGRSEGQFLETWKRGVNAIRSVNPNATIVGPSKSVYWDVGTVDMQDFLTYAKANDVLPDIISWHSWDHNLTSEVNQLKQFAAANNIDASRISIHEYSLPEDHYRPGPIVYWLDAVERNRIESSARACWDGTCFDTSLDGLVTPEGEPRSNWWIYERYNKMSGSTALTVGGATMDTVASQDVAIAHALVGRCSTAAPWEPGVNRCNINSDPAQVLLQNLDEIPALLAGDQVHVLAELIDNSEKAASSGPVVMIDGYYTVTAGQLLLTLPAFGAWDAYFITLSLPGDFNSDGVVDARDYVVLRNAGGSNFAANYSAWRSNFGLNATLGNGAADLATVPEAGTVTLLTIALATCAYSTRRLRPL